MYRATVIGAGRIGAEFDECHARSYSELGILDGLVDIDVSKAIMAYKRWNGNWAANEVLQDADIYSICTPPETHLTILKQLGNAKGIYCEKPIATTLEDADEMIQFCEERGIVLQVNHQRRWGVPTLYYSRGILNTMTHGFDLLRMLFGDNEYKEGYFGKVKIQEVMTDDPVFEFKIDTKNAILKGVEHLIDCIEHGKQSISSGKEAREDLRLCLEMMNDRS